MSVGADEADWDGVAGSTLGWRLRLFVGSLATVAVAVAGAAVAASVSGGVHRPGLVAVVTLIAAVTEGVPLAVRDRGHRRVVLALTEFPVVLAALVLPPAEAVLALALAALAWPIAGNFRKLGPVPPIKAAFNTSMGVVASAAGPLAAATAGPDAPAWAIAVVAGGSAFAVSEVLVSAVRFIATGGRLWTGVPGAALAVAALGTVAGYGTGVLGRHDPVAMTAMSGAVLVLIGLGGGRVRAHLDRARLARLVEFTTQLQACTDPESIRVAARAASADLLGADEAQVTDNPTPGAVSAPCDGAWLTVDDPDPTMAPDQHRELIETVAALGSVAAERTRLVARLEEAAHRDALTGLANRRVAERSLELLVAGDRPVAVLYLDFDRLKELNDTHGHAVGDELIAAAAARLTSLVNGDGLVARMGGDEFVVVLPDAGPAAGEVLAQEVLTGFGRPTRVSVGRVAITPSVGVAAHPDHGLSAGEVLRAADAAMYEAKAAGRGCWRTASGIPAH